MQRASHIVGLLAFQVYLISLPALATAQTGNIESKLNQPIGTYQVVARNFVEALVQTASEFQVPLGIQWVNTARARDPITLSWHDTTVQLVFESIAATQQGYKVAAKNGVLHVFSTEIPSDQNFLSFKINSFDARDMVVEVAERELRSMIRTALSPRSKPVGFGGSLATNTGERNVNVNLSHVSADDILDVLATASDKKIWIVTFAEDSVPLGGLRRTVTLWTDSPVPAEEQPVWNMFHWGDHIPSTGLAAR